ncbi:Sensory transduction protein LytR [Dyadobacter sp. CECT 9275]|uniref:Sensory transduction protein LytR n=1 Tax=Dyadobacter helix TaxID=2822344 RepID=A0A916JK50_9BACT|nr:LytTR family DNA-binding domain-containing protein [Dyadobacter sp. CECT 9275]CAG5016164.1 Sensory transduction protein LytR [Dyadobacter sp. CECT 9275]
MTDVLIIEDEARAARELASTIRQIDADIRVLATLDSVEQSLAWLAANPQPDLIFSDIQLADGLCFEIFNQVTVRSPVIFCTAFDEYLMEAFDTHAVSYLLKPVTRTKIEKALDKFHALKSVFEKQQEGQKLSGLLRQVGQSYKTALLVYQKEKIIPVQVKDIAFFYLDKTLVNITTLSGQQYHLSAKLEELEKVLDPALFWRANRQFLINRAAIGNAEKFFARKLVIKLIVNTPEIIVVSKAKATEFLHWLEGL